LILPFIPSSRPFGSDQLVVVVWQFIWEG
jgi:hypothetical protein